MRAEVPVGEGEQSTQMGSRQVSRRDPARRAAAYRVSELRERTSSAAQTSLTSSPSGCRQLTAGQTASSSPESSCSEQDASAGRD